MDENNSPQVGTTIIEEGNNNGTVSDLNGEFSLKFLNNQGTAIISFIGYFNQNIPVKSDTIIEVKMVEDSITGLISCCFCVTFDPHVSKTGINYGASSNTVGIESQNFIYSIWRLNLKLMADLIWRFIGNEPYLNIRLRRFDIFNKSSFSIGIWADYKSIDEQENKQKFYTVSPDFTFQGYTLSISRHNCIGTI